jgi:hypothetical protein
MTQQTTSLEREIREQPDALRRLLDAELPHLRDLAAGWRARGDLRK